MLTKIVIRNFKRFKEEIEIPLGNGFVFVGPNNSGKTTALQALVFWHAGLKQWKRKRGKSGGNGKPRGVTINRKDLVFLPTAHANALWPNRKVMLQENKRVHIALTVHGNDGAQDWQCGLEFDYSSSESFHCRPLRLDEDGKTAMNIPPQAHDVKMMLLPPMSGIADVEPLIQLGRIDVLLGQGRTAEVLRNVCYALHEKKSGWEDFKQSVTEVFPAIEPEEPVFNQDTGDITLNYREDKKHVFDLQSAGRGMQQAMLLLAFLYYHKPGTMFLLDEPDAHLEILRQTRIYRQLNEIAASRNSQIIIASHSEKLLDESVREQAAVVFLGKPRMLDKDKVTEVKKALEEISSADYYQAEIKKWLLYVEGPTDHKILQAFADYLEHPAKEVLWQCFVDYINTDKGKKKYGHFSSLKLAVPELVGAMLTDHAPATPSSAPEGLTHISWEATEIENYLCTRGALIVYAKGMAEKHDGDSLKYADRMQEQIDIMEKAKEDLGQDGLFSMQNKASEDMKLLFSKFAQKVGIPVLEKKDFFQLVKHIPEDEISPEVAKILDAIYKIAKSAKSRGGE